MSCAVFGIEIFDDFGFDEREVLPRLALGIEVAVPFDSCARNYSDARDFDERATRPRGQKNAFYLHRSPDAASRRCFNMSWPAGERAIRAPVPALCSLTM